MSITESQNLSIHQLCEAIDLLDTCMDDYLYVYDFENDFLKNIKVNGVMVVIGNFTASRQGTSETLYGQIPLPVDYIRSQCKYWTPVIAYDSGNSNPREINWTSINQTDGSVSLYSKRSASNNVTMNYLLFAVK